MWFTATTISSVCFLPLPRRCTPFPSLSPPCSHSQQYTPRPKASHPTCPHALLAVPLKINPASPWVFTATTERTCSAATPPLRVKILTTFSANTPTSVTSNHSMIHILNGIINSLLDTRLMADSRKTTTQDSVPLRLPPPALPVVAAQSLGLQLLQWQLPLHAHLLLRSSRSGQA